MIGRTRVRLSTQHGGNGAAELAPVTRLTTRPTNLGDQGGAVSLAAAGVRCRSVSQDAVGANARVAIHGHGEGPGGCAAGPLSRRQPTEKYVTTSDPA